MKKILNIKNNKCYIKLVLLLKNKKGFNDMHIIFSIASMLVILGIFLPFVDTAFEVDSTTINDPEGLVENVGQDKTITSLSAITIIGSVVKMFFWTFGDLPFFLDIFLLVPRLILVLTLARNIWIGGGS